MTSVVVIHLDTQRSLRRVAVDTSFRLVCALTKTTNLLSVCAVVSMASMVSAPVRLLKVKRVDTSSRRSSIPGIGLFGSKLIRWSNGKSNCLFIIQTLLSSCLAGVSGVKGSPPSKSLSLISRTWSHSLPTPEMAHPSGAVAVLSWFSNTCFFCFGHALS